MRARVPPREPFRTPRLRRQILPPPNGYKMTVSAAGYVLNVPTDRRELLLGEAENGGSFYRSTPFVAEPVYNFETQPPRAARCVRVV